jgi:hypothetical protein
MSVLCFSVAKVSTHTGEYMQIKIYRIVINSVITWQKPTKKRLSASKQKSEVNVKIISEIPFNKKEVARMYFALR